MRTTLAIGVLAASVGWTAALGLAPLAAQQSAMPTTVDGLLSAAKAAAGTNFPGTIPPPLAPGMGARVGVTPS